MRASTEVEKGKSFEFSQCTLRLFLIFDTYYPGNNIQYSPSCFQGGYSSSSGSYISSNR